MRAWCVRVCVCVVCVCLCVRARVCVCGVITTEPLILTSIENSRDDRENEFAEMMLQVYGLAILYRWTE